MTQGLFKATATLLTGSVAAHALPLLLGPALTRTYSPEAFGQFALLWALATNVAVVACARYEYALPLERAEPEAAQLMALCGHVLAAVGLATLCAAGVLAWRSGMATYWLLPLAVLALGATQWLTMWATRSERFGLLSSARLVQYGGGAVLQLALGWWAWLGEGALVHGSAATVGWLVLAAYAAVGLALVLRFRRRAWRALLPTALAGAATRSTWVTMWPAPVTALFAVAPKIAAMALFTRAMISPFPSITAEWQQIVVPTGPVPRFPLMPLLQKAELREQRQRPRVVRVHLRLDSIQLHLSETPGDDCLQRFFGVSTPLMLWRDFIAHDTRFPVSIPAKQAARTNQSWSVFQFHGPARSGNRLFAPARKQTDQFFGAIQIANRIRPKPPHVLAVAMDLKETFSIRRHNLTQRESGCVKRWEIDHGLLAPVWV